MISSFLSATALTDFGLEKSNISSLNERTILITKWNWDYPLSHQFQRHCLKLLDLTPSLRFVICCSHPRVFTNGRGLQKPRKGETLDLVDFDKTTTGSLPFPFYQIERGGGLTFHHPGQMIIYPILRLNPKTLSLSSMIDTLFDAAIEVLNEWGIQNLNHANKLLGLWHEDRKIASMGIAIEKLTTFHGMALNFYKDDEMRKALQRVNPCGLKAETYTSVEELMDLKLKNLENFSEVYLRRLAHVWK
jgi:lipoate-protein ligase B